MAFVNRIGKSLTLRVNCGTLTGAVSERRFTASCVPFRHLQAVTIVSPFGRCRLRGVYL